MSVAIREVRQQGEKVSRAQTSDLCYDIRDRDKKGVYKADNFRE